MQLVLCDVCEENTNREVPVGTVTRTFKKDWKTGQQIVASQEFFSDILPLTTAGENQERLHVCLTCFNSGMVSKKKKAQLPTVTAAPPNESGT